MRYERKYPIPAKQLSQMLHLLRQHPAGFRPLFPERQVNNIYFDTPNLNTFHQNVYGFGQRKKFRVRWYGEEVHALKDPQLEIKVKDHELGEKEIFPLDAATIPLSTGLIKQVNQCSRYSRVLVPVLLNSYRRHYLISRDGHFRVTLDVDMRYHSLLLAPQFRSYLIHDPGIIMELKYESEQDDAVQFISQHIPFRQDKHSKYIRGVLLTHP